MYCIGSLYCTKCCVFTTIWRKKIIWCTFNGFKSKRLFRMNLVHGNTDNISHVPILKWPGMTSSLTSHGPVNDITQHSFLKFASCVIIPLETSMESFRGKYMLWKFALYSNQCYLQEDSITEKFPWIFPHPNFIKNTITLDVSNGVIVRFVHRVL